MKANEALELTKKNRLNQQEMENIFSRIRGTAREGRFETFFVDLSPAAIDELRNLGYVVTSQFSRNESNDCVFWGNVRNSDEGK